MSKLRTMLMEILEDIEDGNVNVSQGWGTKFVRVSDKDVIFGISFNSVEDHDMVWQQRFTLGKKYKLFVDVVLPTKQKKVRAALIEEWHKFKQHKIQEGEEAASFLKTERGIVFDSKFYKYESLKAIGLFKRHLNDLCDGDLFSGEEVEATTALVPVS